jgi:hypothetical protein
MLELSQAFGMLPMSNIKSSQSAVNKQIMWHTTAMSAPGSDRCESFCIHKETLWLDDQGDVICREPHSDLIMMTVEMLRNDPELFAAISLIQMKLDVSSHS